MGASPSQVPQDNSDDAIMRQIATSEGPSGVVRYIENNIDRWKNEPVKFGIIGRSASGKSSFVNLVRDVKEGAEGYAKVGRGDTTRSPTPYFHPNNKQIVYWDLPVLEEVDVWLAKELIRMRKPFCLVRSKVDLDVEEGTDAKTVINKLRTETLLSMDTDINLKTHCKIFFISCVKRNIGEIDALFQHIRENLPSIKFEAVVYSLNTLSQEVIEEKYKSLKSRVSKASVGTALIAASPIPGFDFYANISILVKEIKHYIEVFGLTSKQIRKVGYRDQKQLRCKEFFGLGSAKRIHGIVTKMFIQKYLFLITTLSISDIFLPIVGSVVSAGATATIVNKFLNDILENLKQDAIFVYDLILPLPARLIRKLQVIFEKEGQEGINKYIFDVLNRWKDEPVVLGVIGEPYSGKFEFINYIRCLKIGNSGFAKDTKNTTPYYHPNNEGIVFIETDLCGSKEMQISCYDDFFVFLNGDIYADDISILHELAKIKKSFSVTRTKSARRKQEQDATLGRALSVKRDKETNLVRPELLVNHEKIDSVKPKLLVKKDKEINLVKPEILVKRDDEIDSVRPEVLDKRDEELDSVKPELLVKSDKDIYSVKTELLVKRDEEIDSVKPELLVKRDEEIDSVRLREILCPHMYKDIEYENDMDLNVCVLTCLNINIREIDELIHNLVQNLPQAKSAAFLNALHPLSRILIEEKFQSLKKRIVCVTIAATPTTAFQIPSICFPVIMHILVDEITHYIKVFGFSNTGEELCRITKAESNELLCRELLEPGVVFSDIINRQLKVLSTDAIGNIAAMFVPVAGSVVSTANNAAIVYKCLTRFLDDLKHDAFVVYDCVLTEYKSMAM
ncbi:unnamed protein product [Mytilus coruscus]|uniref:IRG-type G domain-containing protein n=1 Tax=Mytilus coruscus TaxID=42192 RepID=A0A6J8BBW5_MYTCO|nr:unnamed protein product [Mytilus coruscus]